MIKRQTKKRPGGGFRSSNPEVSGYFLQHLRVALASLGRICRSPVAATMTATVIGIALALPTGLHLVLNGLQTLSSEWDSSASLSLFLREEVSDGQAEALTARLGSDPRVAQANLIDRDAALIEFRHLSGFGEVIDTLGENPLPSVITLTPRAEFTGPGAAAALADELAKLPEIELAQFDLDWVRRFHAMTEIASRATQIVASLFALAVLLIVGNTIRLDIQNRIDEIEITKLVGATDAFIRRPFLYGGFWYGLFGGAVAWLLVSLSLQLLREPIERLAGLYQHTIGLSVLDLRTSVTLLSVSAALGIGGSWLAVGRHLRKIEPT